jgi:hypothetical protein
MSRPSRLSLDILHLKALIAHDEFQLRDARSGPATERSWRKRRELQSTLASRRLQLALLQGEQHRRNGYDPNQPRVPAGHHDGGQWTSAGGGGRMRLGAAERVAVGRSGLASDGRLSGLADVDTQTRASLASYGLAAGSPGDQFEIVQPAVMSYEEKVRMFFGQRDLFGGGGSAGGPFLPAYRQGGPTAGVLQTPGRADIELMSGTGGPASRMPAGAPGFNLVIRTHVEGQAAALMRELGIKRATLYINNPEICPGCATYLPRMLPPGATLDVVLPSGPPLRFTGAVR